MIIFLSFIPMLEEHTGKKQDSSRTIISVNHQILKLLQQKTIPLNRARYYHLQKISKALRKKQPHTYASSTQLTLNQSSFCSQGLPQLHKAHSYRAQPMVVADLLIDRLKSMKDLHSSRKLQLKNEPNYSWEPFGSNLFESSKTIDKETSLKTLKIIQGRRKQQNLLDVGERVQKYLRQKKHDLKERYRKQEEYIQNRRKKSLKPSQIEMILTTFKSLTKQGKVTTEQIQSQMLKDIKESMLQEKINRIKRDINHKKIVQLR